MSEVEMTFSGIPALERALNNIKKVARHESEALMTDSTLGLHELAIKGIQKVSQGENQLRYTKGSTPRRVVVSKPGDPPNTDTGRAISSINFEINHTALNGKVGTKLDYLIWLELGTRKMEARHWLSSSYFTFIHSRLPELILRYSNGIKKGAKAA